MAEVYTTLTPRLVVRDAHAAVAFYRDVLDADPGMVIEEGGRVVHAEMVVAGMQMSVTESDGGYAKDPQHLGATPVVMMLVCDDPDAIAARAVAHGGTLVFEVDDRPYGMRDGRFRDPQGHEWMVTKMLEHLSAEELQRRMDGR
ncbi:MAG: VOC family protein [Myxococcota bacterium]